MILNGLRWQIRAINLDMPACFAGGAFIRARITHWRLVRSNEGKKQKQMGRSRRRKPLFGSGFRLFLRVVSCESAVVRKKLPFPDAFKVAVAAAETGLPFYRGRSGCLHPKTFCFVQIPPNFQRFARQDRLGLSEPYLEICSLIEEKRLKMLLEAGILAWSDDLETAYGVVNWLFTKVETKKRCQNEFVLTAKRLNFGPIMQEKSAT